MTSHRLEITKSGYLRVSAATARSLFPGDALIALYRDGQLLLLPTRGPAGGGLLLKQYNPSGDRCVLLNEVLPTTGVGTDLDGIWEGEWDEQAHALRVPLGVVS